MFFKHIYEPGLAHASYIVGCQKTGEALVIDAKRDIDDYLKIAEAEKLKITHIAETHIHADFLAGSQELHEVTGAKLYLSDEGGPDWQYSFPHVGLKDGDSFMVGNLKIEVVHTPGHTPEHISFLLTDTPASPHPVMMFTGDFVFVGDVGRPDLLEKAAGIIGTKEVGAHQMFHSLKKFKALPDHIQVWPAHGAGSACGKALGAVPSSTVGYEKLVNWALQIDDEEKFVTALLEGQPEPPKYFAMMKRLNKTTRPLLTTVPSPKKLHTSEILEAIASGVRIIDTRNKLSFAGGHIPGSINIQDNSAFSTWAGWILNYEDPFILIASEGRIESLTKALIRIGLDNIKGYLADIEELSEAGLELEILKQFTCNDLEQNEESCFILDVRNESEREVARLNNSHHIFAGYITEHVETLPEDKTIVVHCAGGDRSAIAASLLMSMGFDNVANLTGGINAWIQSGHKVINN
ncbi:MAG: MBL fold metallo-hydrolase [Ignavibacteriales bacterium]|jgi:hydroxyacylglutathione hydrolase|nr:MBL fold metallo-hydrolase [Ignavibacteriales bacterium]MBK8660461.1 MBL fold metallo-hydrolase [Ignavibacteriales bacterium]MBP9123138.1 MBL fold metallo-hydrolase [Ignavibacteriaceae bacterium]MCC6637745.1 MBL fold metallo-hydrolase [Ignavibacteriaceae bacterium]